MSIEPFGYFRADACGWTDCHDDDDGAQPLWDNAAMCAIEKQRDELLEALVDQVREAKRCKEIMLREAGIGLIDEITLANSEAAIAKVKGGIA